MIFNFFKKQTYKKGGEGRNLDGYVRAATGGREWPARGHQYPPSHLLHYVFNLLHFSKR